MIKQRFLAIVLVDDYHEFKYICDAFVNQDLSYREIGMYRLPFDTYSKYLGIIFEGTSPGDGEIHDALNEAQINEDLIDA